MVLPHRYHARYGWVVVLLGHADVALLGMLLRLAWAGVAPKRLLKGAS